MLTRLNCKSITFEVRFLKILNHFKILNHLNHFHHLFKILNHFIHLDYGNVTMCVKRWRPLRASVCSFGLLILVAVSCILSALYSCLTKIKCIYSSIHSTLLLKPIAFQIKDSLHVWPVTGIASVHKDQLSLWSLLLAL